MIADWLKSILPDWMVSGNATDEDQTPRDGFLSTTTEIHATAVGAAFGLLTAITMHPGVAAFFAAVIMGAAKVKNDHLRDAAKEVAYSGGAFVVLFGVGLAVRGVTPF